MLKMIWNQLLLIALLQLIYVSTRSIESFERPHWLEQINDMIREADLVEEVKQLDDERLPYYHKLRESDIRVNEKRTFLSSLKSSSEKRALSMFARWGPVNTIGKDRNPIRSGYTPKTSDSISTQTRGRMLGQPLRWG